MRVFVAGATGVVGRRAVRRLVGAGHRVTGVARSRERAALLERLGAAPVTVDPFDAAAVRAAVAGHDAVCNLATSIPPASRAALPGAWAANDRLRGRASGHLVDAALAAGAARYVQESVTFLYADRGGEWIGEDAPVDAPPHLRSALAAERAAGRFAGGGGVGVVLRFGLLYGPDSVHTLDAVRLARRRVAPTVGAPDAYLSSITTDDAAAAVLAALEAPSSVYNAVDDEPLPRRAYADALADALGVGRPRMVPAAATRLGGPALRALARSQRVGNRRLREATGWAPAHPDARQGWPAVVAALGAEASRA